MMWHNHKQLLTGCFGLHFLLLHIFLLKEMSKAIVNTWINSDIITPWKHNNDSPHLGSCLMLKPWVGLCTISTQFCQFCVIVANIGWWKQPLPIGNPTLEWTAKVQRLKSTGLFLYERMLTKGLEFPHTFSTLPKHICLLIISHFYHTVLWQLRRASLKKKTV